ncbi:hypothetical protein [Gracilibacillus sp. YIM 98692]|uniref:hypothetical protein n=1 Tax=Gracilibacillus sp. YIM 98692 TaxID=2663532 RepID=UPI0013D6B924|nr:hypothetical protein [Gracilibacillus sp. YIM 98692]
MKKIIVLFLFIILVACQENNETLNMENLEVDQVIQNANDHEGKQYKAPSLDVAINAIPFNLNVPNLPKTFEPFKPISIIDWLDTEDGEDISIQLLASSNDKNSKTLTIYARDFEINDLNEDSEKITLDNNKEVYFIPDRLSNDGHSVSVEWKQNGVFYSLNFSGKTDNPNKANEMLIDLVHKMQ